MELIHDCHNPQDIASTRGGYSHAVEVVQNCRYLFISGQVPVRPDGTVPDTFPAQCHVVWDNLFRILATAGYEPNQIVKITTFLSSRSYGDDNGAIRRERLGDLSPALTVVITGIYDSSWLLEIEAIAARPNSVKFGAK
jgi:2-iminobutanoate/2-iminopropanoate deaminase